VTERGGNSPPSYPTYVSGCPYRWEPWPQARQCSEQVVVGEEGIVLIEHLGALSVGLRAYAQDGGIQEGTRPAWGRRLLQGFGLCGVSVGIVDVGLGFSFELIGWRRRQVVPASESVIVAHVAEAGGRWWE